MSRVRPLLLPAALLALLFLVPFWGLWTNPGPPMEEGFMLVFPDRLLHGDLPNRDFLHLYGPGSLWVLASLFWVFGTRLAVERAVGIAQILGIVTGVFVLVRPWGRWIATSAAAVAMLVVLTPTGFTALAWVGGVALGTWAIHHGITAVEADDPPRRRLWWCGLLVGAALLYRLDLVVALALSIGIVLWHLAAHDRRRLLTAIAVGVSPYLVHLVTAGPGNVVRGMVLEPVFDLRGGRRLPLPPSGTTFDGFLQKAWLLPNVKPPYPLPHPEGPAQMRLWLVLLLVATVFLVVAGIRANRRGEVRLLVMAAFAAGLLPQALQRADSTHLAWVSFITFAFVPAALADVLAGRSARGARAWTAALLVPVVLLAAVPFFTYRSYGESVAQTFGMRRRTYEMRNGDRIFRYGRQDAAEDVNDLVHVVEDATEPGDSVFVGPVDLRKTPYSEAYLYYLLPDLVPATRYIEMDPGMANAPDSGLAEELAKADVAVLSSIQSSWDEPNNSRVEGPDAPNEVLREQFRLVKSYGDGPGDRGVYEVWVHR